MKRKVGDTERPRSLNPGKALAMAICLIICLFYQLARALMDDVACEFACAVRMHRNNCKCNLFTHEAPRSSQELVQKCPYIPGSNQWNLEMLVFGEKGKPE